MKKELRAEARAKKAEAKKKAATNEKLKLGAIIAIPCLFIIAIIAVAFIARDKYSLVIDYDAGLDGEGRIVNINVADYVDVCDYANIVVPKAEVEMTEEKLNEHIESILDEYSIEELTDEFIAEKYSDVASTVDEYLLHVKTTTMQENVEDYIYDYVIEHSTVKSYPKNYFKDIRKNTDRQYKAQFQYYNQMLYQYTGSYMWDSYLDYYSVSRSEYKDMIKETTEKTVKEALVLQYIYEDLKLTITNEEINETIFSFGYEESDAGLTAGIEDYTMPYLRQLTAGNKVITYLSENVTIE